MDLVEGIGQRYLMGKANAAPQQVENLVKKQFKGDVATAGGKAESAAPNIARDKEIEELRKQLAQVKAAQNQSAAPNAGKNKEIEDMRKQRAEMKVPPMRKATGPTGRRESIESVASRGRSRTPREPKESPPSKASQSAKILHHHHAGSEKLAQWRPAASHNDEISKAEQSSSTNAPTARPVTLPSYNMPGIRPNRHSVPPDPVINSYDKAPTSTLVKTTGTHPRHVSDRARLDSVSERPRPATDLCVVEVTEEEPRSRRRGDRGGRSNVVEVIEKRGNQTRYIVD